MRVGDLVKSIPKGYLGIVVEEQPNRNCTLKSLWRIHWLHKGTLTLRPAYQVEVISGDR